MNNSEYWRKRYEELNEKLLEKGDKYAEALEREYEKAFQSMENDIKVFYQRFADNNNITYNDAVKLLNSKERKAFQMTVDEYIKKGKENGVSADWIKELESASNIYHIDRLKSLQLQIRHEIEILSAKKLKDMKEIFTDTYIEGYYKSLYELQKGMGHGAAFSTLDTARVDQALAMVYDSDGLNFSGKIWKDRNYLARTLETEFPQMIIRGKGPDELINLLSKRFGVSKSAASNLVMTESAFLASYSRKEAMESIGVEEFEIDATLDTKTCKTCGDLDGKHLPMDTFEPWVTAPPFHHRCRCTTVPYFNDEFTQNEQRAARNPETGKTEYVSANMKYNEWYEKYVDKQSKGNYIKNIDKSKLNKSTIDEIYRQFNMIPKKHQEILENYITEIKHNDRNISRFDREKRILYVANNLEEGEFIHECGHALETFADLYHNESFLKVLNRGLENLSPIDIINDETSLVIPIRRVVNSKFISPYQGYIYSLDIDGNEIINFTNFTFNTKCLGEYFSEGYREYLINPLNLKKHDLELYNFIEGFLI